jgi:acetyl-CoA synthetase
LGSVEAWQWYHQVVGDGQLPIVDTWWQTELGATVISPLPQTKNAKPGSCMLPFYGCQPVLLDEKGKEIQGNNVTGQLALKRAVPGMARTIVGDHQRFVNTYFKEAPGYYVAGDEASRDGDGHYWIKGRIDDVINVSGHRLGTAEVESALVAHKDVAEAAVVGYPHEIKGEGIFAYVTLKEGKTESSSVIQELKNAVRTDIGAFATPDRILISSQLPKTRSGKIMRRILKKIAKRQTEDLGDLSTLNEPEVIEILIQKEKELSAQK